MLQNVYTLPDLVDLALKVPEIGAVNFNILHTVLQTMIYELRIKDVRPWCQIENPILAKSALTRSKLKGDALGKVQSQDTLKPEAEKPPMLLKKAFSDEAQTEPKGTLRETSKVLEDHEPADEQEETEEQEIPQELPDETPKDEESLEQPKERRKRAGWDDITKELKVHRQSLQIDEGKRAKTAKEVRHAKDAWKYTNLDTRLEATEEGLMRLTDIVDMLADRIKKFQQRLQAGGTFVSLGKAGVPGGLQEGSQTEGGIGAGAGLEEEDTISGPLSGLIPDPIAKELNQLEERVEVLEEAKIVFDKDHQETLPELAKTQEEMLKEFEKLQSLREELTTMKDEISGKADAKAMEEALALKADLALVNQKVGRDEFERAIEELGEAIGLLGIKLQKKSEEWDERAAEIWKGIDAKMSRNVFDEAMLKLESRLTAILFALKRLKKVVEDLLYPDASGVTRCIVCRRPADISGHECIVVKSPKRPLKSSGESSDGYEGSDSLRNIIHDTVSKRQKLDGPPYCPSENTIVSIPFNPAMQRRTPDVDTQQRTPSLKMGTVSAELRDKDVSNGPSQIPKLPNICPKETGSNSPMARRKPGVQRSMGKGNLPHKKLIFTNKMLEDLTEQEEGEQVQAISKRHSIILDISSTSSKNTSRASSSVDIMNDSLKEMNTFRPTRFMADPLRRDISPTPGSPQQPAPAMVLTQLSSNSSFDNNASSD